MTSKASSKKKMLFKLGMIFIGLALIIGLVYFVGRQVELSANSAEVERGDLAARFADARAVTYAGKKYAYNPTLTGILLMGIDKDENQPAYIGFRSGAQVDFLMLMVLDAQNKTVTRIQIDRDTMTQQTVFGILGNVIGTRQAQISLAYGFGVDGHESSKLTVQAVKNLLGDIDIDLYATLNLDAIAALNDWLGGVTVTIADDFSAVDPAMMVGSTIRLKGPQAEYFVRSRMNVGDGSNAQRMIRQRQFLAGANSLMQQRLQKDKLATGSLFDLLSSQMITSMSRGRMINETDRAYSYKMGDIISLKGQHSSGDNGFNEFHADQAALTELVLDTFYLPVE